MRKTPVGWRREPARHALAAKGVKTLRKSGIADVTTQRRKIRLPDDLLVGEIYSTKEIENILGVKEEDMFTLDGNEYWEMKSRLTPDLSISVDPALMWEAFEKLPMKEDVETATIPVVVHYSGVGDEHTEMLVKFNHKAMRQDYEVRFGDAWMALKGEEWGKTTIITPSTFNEWLETRKVFK